MSALLPIVGAVLVAAGVVFAQTLSECQTMRENQRRTARANAEQEMGRCREDRQCVTEARSRMENSMERGSLVRLGMEWTATVRAGFGEASVSRLTRVRVLALFV